jgi:hypothetical protein
MLSFKSASVRIVDSTRAVETCITQIYGNGEPTADSLWMVNAAVGHKLDRVAAAIRERVRNATVVATTCAGVVGSEGYNDAVASLAVMVVEGPTSEWACAAVDGYTAATSYECAQSLAMQLKQQLGTVRQVYLLVPGLDGCSDKAVQAFDETLDGREQLFGGLSADNMKARGTVQCANGFIGPQVAWAIGFNDASLLAACRATHGFTVSGEAMVITRASRNVIYEFNGRPAFEVYNDRIRSLKEQGLEPLLVAGGLARRLEAHLCAAYGNEYILGMAKPDESDGTLVMRRSARVDDI